MSSRRRLSARGGEQGEQEGGLAHLTVLVGGEAPHRPLDLGAAEQTPLDQADQGPPAQIRVTGLGRHQMGGGGVAVYLLQGRQGGEADRLGLVLEGLHQARHRLIVRPGQGRQGRHGRLPHIRLSGLEGEDQRREGGLPGEPAEPPEGREAHLRQGRILVLEELLQGGAYPGIVERPQELGGQDPQAVLGLLNRPLRQQLDGGPVVVGGELPQRAPAPLGVLPELPLREGVPVVNPLHAVAHLAARIDEEHTQCPVVGGGHQVGPLVDGDRGHGHGAPHPVLEAGRPGPAGPVGPRLDLPVVSGRVEPLLARDERPAALLVTAPSPLVLGLEGAPDVGGEQPVVRPHGEDPGLRRIEHQRRHRTAVELSALRGRDALLLVTLEHVQVTGAAPDHQPLPGVIRRQDRSAPVRDGERLKRLPLPIRDHH